MGLHDYQQGMKIAEKDPPFYALIQAAMRKADTANLHLLKICWPDVWLELRDRYNAPGGLLQSEIKREEKNETI